MKLTLLCVFVLAFTVRPTGAMSKPSIGEFTTALIEAIKFLKYEDLEFRERFEAGVDRLSTDIEEVEADLFDGPPAGSPAIERNSRLINRLGFIFRTNKWTGLEKFVKKRCPYNQPKCKGSYRTIDGTCNNEKNGLWGSALTPFQRLLDPSYESIEPIPEKEKGADDLPRSTGENGKPLPSAREVSRAVHQISHPSSASELSFITTTWGQFIAHDVTLRAAASGTNGSKVACCNQNPASPPKECFNIDIANSDKSFGKGNDCLGFLRSLEATDLNCEEGRREQLNAATSYIDASTVYGSTNEEAEDLRTGSGGLLTTSEPNQLPQRCHENRAAERGGFSYFQAGDPRVSEVTPLTAVHTMWVREHNRIADELAKIKEGWNDETLYQEARRIVIAEIQHITYDEWLPLLIGKKLVKKYELHSGAYDPNINASTANVAATASLRFGHSMVRPDYNLYNRDYTATSSPALRLRDLFYRSNIYLLNEQSLVRGILTDNSETVDNFITTELTDHLFEFRPNGGADLVAFNIQRGRDHGIPPYNDWRKLLKLSRCSFAPGGCKDIPEEVVNNLKIYKNPDDIDLFSGAISENPVADDAILGPTFANLNGMQFQKYRTGDRFWYEYTDAGFSDAQINEIKKTSLARVLCDTFDLDTVQPNAFQLPTVKKNGRRKCKKIEGIDLGMF